MRVWKKNKGTVAHLVLLIGLLISKGAIAKAEQAKDGDTIANALKQPEHDVPGFKANGKEGAEPSAKVVPPANHAGASASQAPEPPNVSGGEDASKRPGGPTPPSGMPPFPNMPPSNGAGMMPPGMGGAMPPNGAGAGMPPPNFPGAQGSNAPNPFMPPPGMGGLPPNVSPQKGNAAQNQGAPALPPKAVISDEPMPIPPPNFQQKGPVPSAGSRQNGGREQTGATRGASDAFSGPPPSRGPSNGRRGPASANEDEIFKVVPQTCVPAKGEFVWHFEEEELINILRQVSDLLCKTIVVHETIAKNMKMTIIGQSKLTPKDAWDVLMAALAAKGLTMIEQGKTWTVVKRNESKNFATPMYQQGNQARNNEEIGTLFYKTQHASQDALKNIARLLISKDGLVEAVGDSFVIVIDSNSNLRRLGAIFAQIDIEDALNKIHVIKLENADAKTVEKQLRDLFDISTGGGGPRRPRGMTTSKSTVDIDKIIADERTNSLIVIAEKDAVEKLKEVVALVDQPAGDQANKGKIHVMKLRFGDAKKIADTLNNVVSQGRGASRYGRRRDEPTNELFEGEVKVTAHEVTNTLVTVASANDYAALSASIRDLDKPKKQIYIEAVILDVQVNDDSAFGINLFSGLQATIPGTGGASLGVLGNPGGRGLVKEVAGKATANLSNIAGLGTNSLGALAVLNNFLDGGVAGIVGPNIGQTQIPSFGAVVKALSTSKNVDVLSTPYLLTTDNQQAEMAVGERIPVIKGASTMGGGGNLGLGIPVQNVEHLDVKLSFKVTPHVGEDDNVSMDIEQEVNELGPEEPILQQKQYRIRTKSAKTTLVLKDQQTGVIGGLMHHKSLHTDDKVPFLGDIPILGWLFKTRTKNVERRSLLLIITPYIINTEDDYRKVIERKLKEREEFARLYYGGKLKEYNPHIEYDKKAGPLASTILHMDAEMNKVENGGPGDGSDVVISPKEPDAPKFEKATFIETSSGGQTAFLGEESSSEMSAADFPIEALNEESSLYSSEAPSN